MANLCVMQMYAKGTICNLFRATVASNPRDLAYPEYYDDAGFKRGALPWLYYEENAL